MGDQDVETIAIFMEPPDEARMLAANVNPKTGLATDFLNLFNEYIMLAQLVADGSMERDVLCDWLPVDYETHFSLSSFSGSQIVLASYRTLKSEVREEFELAVNQLTELILDHQFCEKTDLKLLDIIKHQRDQVSTLIADPVHDIAIDVDDTQAAIDALFD